MKEDKLFVFGKNKNLIATGGEMIQTTGIFGNAINLVMGHNFTNANQKYQDAIYPFSVVEEDSVTVSTPITDVINPKVQVADDLSNFRRRDGPVLPALFKNPVNGQIQQGISIYGGVFKPGNVLQAWNDAIYIHPDWSNNEGRYFTEDKKYNQNNYNVYSCPNFVVYDLSLIHI